MRQLGRETKGRDKREHQNDQTINKKWPILVKLKHFDLTSPKIRSKYI
jgi:hypothetical protein